MHIEYPPSKSISDLVKQLKGRSSRLLQKEFPELGKDIGGSICGELVMELGVQETLQTI